MDKRSVTILEFFITQINQKLKFISCLFFAFIDLLLIKLRLVLTNLVDNV